MAKRTLKVFCDPESQAELAATDTVVESYDSFVLVEATPARAERLARTYPVEDITDLYEIRLRGRAIDTSRPRIDRTGRARAHPAYRTVKELTRGKHHYLVQFRGPIKPAWIARLRRLGGEPRAPFSDFVYVVRCDPAAVRRIAADPVVRWMGHLSHADRVHLAEDKLPRTKLVEGTYAVEFFDRKDMRKAEAAVRDLGVEILSRDDAACVMTILIDQPVAKLQRMLGEMSAVHGVRSIRRRALPRTSNDVAAGIMNARRAIRPSIGLDGSGETVAICDTGLDAGSRQNVHPDFAGRVVALRSYPIVPYFSPWIRNPRGDDGPADLASGHGTHVAGSAVGSGAGSGNGLRGLAPGARLVFQAVEQEMRWRNIDDYFAYGRYLLAGIPDDLTELFRYAYDRGARIHSNSWGGGDPGAYDAQCRQLDDFVWKKKDFCVLVAAGNDGTDEDGDGRINAMSVTAPGTAKNCITVGASESLRPQFNGETYGDWWPDDYPVAPYRDAPMANGPAQVVAFSSRGPTADGRVKPDVVAPGTYIASARSRMLDPSQTAWGPYPGNGLYFYMGGTSMATPLVAGAVALLRQFLREWVGYERPSAALLKACLLLGARKLSGYSSSSAVFDNDQGYGRVDVDAVVAPPAPAQVYFLDDPAGLHTGQSDTFELTVRSSRVPLRIALCYSDHPGEALVNNLNLIVRDPRGRMRVGNGSTSGALAMDTTNNSEVVHVRAPRSGQWTIQVVGSNVPRGPQPYAFALSGDVR